MIFVTVGTHEQQFNRLLREVDRLKADKIIADEIIMQTGFSTYEPRYCEWKSMFSYEDMKQNIQKARIVMTHGGPSSIIMPLQMGKVPIVIPRQKQFDEHVNDHQTEFCRYIAKRQGNIIVVEDMEHLGRVLQEYDCIVSSMHGGLKSNNARFCEEFEKLVNEMTGAK